MSDKEDWPLFHTSRSLPRNSKMLWGWQWSHSLADKLPERKGSTGTRSLGDGDGDDDVGDGDNESDGDNVSLCTSPRSRSEQR